MPQQRLPLDDSERLARSLVELRHPLVESTTDSAGRVIGATGATDLFIRPPFTFKAVERLVASYQPLVAKIAARYRASGIPMEDLVSVDDLSPTEPVEAVEESAPEQGDGGACAWCRAELPKRSNLNFCPFCGTDVNLVPCPGCGEEVEPGWRFCIGCGTEVHS